MRNESRQGKAEYDVTDVARRLKIGATARRSCNADFQSAPTVPIYCTSRPKKKSRLLYATPHRLNWTRRESPPPCQGWHSGDRPLVDTFNLGWLRCLMFNTSSLLSEPKRLGADSAGYWMSQKSEEVVPQRVVYFNGQFVAEDEARISIFDSSLMFGDMAFEMTRTYGGHPFRLRYDFARFT